MWIHIDRNWDSSITSILFAPTMQIVEDVHHTCPVGTGATRLGPGWSATLTLGFLPVSRDPLRMANSRQLSDPRP